MQISLLGGRDLRLPAGWGSETSYTLIGGAKVDATAEPRPGAKLRVYTVIGGADVLVPKGARVRLKGGSLIGGRKLDVSHGDGPEITILACALLGGVRVHEA